MDYPKDYVVWDLETTGLYPDKCKILEVGWAVVLDGKVSSKSSYLLDWKEPVPQIITEITGITDGDVEREGLEPTSVIINLMQILDVAPAHVTHNGYKFDLPFLLAAVEKVAESPEEYENFKSKLYSKMIDTAHLFKAQKLGREQREGETMAEFADRVMNERVYGLKYSVSVCCDELKIPKTTQHRALGDVLLTNQIYQCLTHPTLL